MNENSPAPLYLFFGSAFMIFSGYYLFMIVFRPRALRRTFRMRHTSENNTEKQPPVSRLFAFWWALLIGTFGYGMVVSGYLHRLNPTAGASYMHVIVALFFLILATAIYDTVRWKWLQRRAQKRRTARPSNP